MPKHGKTRHGSLQFYPRVRAKQLLPSVRWNSLNNEKVNLLGFIGYKVGMKSAYVRDNTLNSHTKGKRIAIPVTILECPTMKILSIRFYKEGNVLTEILNKNLDKELKKKIKLTKKESKKIEDIEKEGKFDDVKIIVYSQSKKTSIKKSPDITEIGLSGKLEEKLGFIKENLNKEIHIKDIFSEGLVDVRGVTKGKGTQGPTKRFGLTLKTHKEEKGQRGPGSGGPWHPARVDFRLPMAGQMGFFTRIVNNSNVVYVNSISENDINPITGFKHYGKIKSDYIILFGSMQGPTKRQVLITHCQRPHKGQLKKNFEFISLR